MIAQNIEPIVSTLADDEDMSELVAIYVDEVAEKINAFENFLATRQWDDLKRAAHQLKGSAGGYGFDCLTPFASRLEASLGQAAELENVEAQVQVLVLHLRAIRAR